MRSLRLAGGIAVWVLLSMGCQNGTGLRNGPDAGKDGAAGGGTAGAGGGITGAGGGTAASAAAGTSGGGMPGTGGGGKASATGGSSGGASVGTDAAATSNTYARPDTSGDARNGTGGTTDAVSLPDSGGATATDARDGNGDGPLDASRKDGGLDAASDRSQVDLGASDTREAAAGDVYGPFDSGVTESGAMACSEVPCLASLFLPCQPTAPCTSEQSTTPTGSATNTCYANGVKQQVLSTFSGNDIFVTSTEKREAGVCFTIEVSLSLTATSALYIFRDGAGNQVATGTAAVNTDVLIVTCNGGNPTQVSQACLDTASVSSTCTAGVCDF